MGNKLAAGARQKPAIAPVRLSAGEIADMRSALAAIQCDEIDSARDQARLAMQLALNLSVIAADVLRRSKDRGASALGSEVLGWLVNDREAEAAFGFRQRGGVSPERARAIAERDDLLLRLAHLDGMLWAPLPPGPAARAMRLSFDRYETCRWTRERDAVGAPPMEPATTWWRILQGSVPMPGVDRLRQILASCMQRDVCVRHLNELS